MNNTLSLRVLDKDGNIVSKVESTNIMVPNWLIFKNQNTHGGNSSVVSCAVMDLNGFAGPSVTLDRTGLLSEEWGTSYRMESPTLTTLPSGMMYQYSGTFNPPLANMDIRGFGITATHGGCANQLMSFVHLVSPITWNAGNTLAFTYTISFYQTNIPE